jgi:hypothetical protein
MENEKEVGFSASTRHFVLFISLRTKSISRFSGFNVGSIRRPRGDVREIGLLPALEFGIDSEYSSGGDDPPLPAPPVGSEAPEAALKAPRFKAVAAGHLHSLLLCEAGR